MSKLMLIFGILFMSLGVALGFLIHFKPGQMQVVALTPEVSAILLVGGALCLGLGGLIGALRDRGVAAVPAEVVAEAATEKSATPTRNTEIYRLWQKSRRRHCRGRDRGSRD